MYRFLMNGRRYVILFFAMNSAKEKNIQQLSKDSDMTPSHLTIVMKQWEKEGLLNKIKNGREFVIKLTEVGKEVLDILKKYDEIAMRQSEKEVKNGTT